MKLDNNILQFLVELWSLILMSLVSTGPGDDLAADQDSGLTIDVRASVLCLESDRLYVELIAKCRNFHDSSRICAGSQADLALRRP